MKRTPIERVSRLAENKESIAARALAKKIAIQKQAEEKQAQISEYRHQYETHLENLGQAGINSQTLKDYRQFLGNLDNAIDQQSMVVSQTALQVNESKSEWLKTHQHKSALEKLVEKQETEQVLRAEKRQQRYIDELNSRR